MKKSLFINFIVSSILLGNIVEKGFFIQDYLDFGQNKGRYTAGVQGVLIMKKNSNTYGDYSNQGQFFDITMPDFSGPVDKAGNKTFLGGSYVGTAKHVFDNTVRWTFVSPDYTYNFIDRKNSEPDRSYARYNKFITTSEPVNLLEVTPNNPLDISRYTHFWRAGQGRLYFIQDDGSVSNINTSLNILYYVTTGGIVKFEKVLDDTRLLFSRKDTFFSNMVTEGDSGSPMFAWDSYEKKWVVIGFAKDGDMATIGHYTPHRQHELDALIEQYTNPTVYLNGEQATWDGTTIKNSKDFTTTVDKDIVLKGGGEITLTQHINQKSGGFYFDENQSYIITSGKNQWAWMGGGLYIGDKTTVTWDVNGYTINDGLFKVGKGTLHIIRENISWLNLGDGKVILDTTSNAFKHYVLVSGRGTLQLTKNKTSSIDTNKLFFF